MPRNQSLPELIEAYRDRRWHRDADDRVEDAVSAEKFIERVGFCSALTDSRRPGPSLYIAVCGRRDAHTPRNVQKDPETGLAWEIKDEVMRRGRVYYGKLLRGRSTFVCRRLLPSFYALWGVPRKRESVVLSPNAQKALRVLRREWEMSSGDLRKASRIDKRSDFNRAIDELQRTLRVIPVAVVSKPTFTYIWALTEIRFQEELRVVVSRDQALKNIAAAYLLGAGMTLQGELASVTGLSRPDAGAGNWALVDEGLALREAPGVYRWRDLPGSSLVAINDSRS